MRKTIALLLSAAALWVICSGVHELVPTLGLKRTVTNLQYIGITSVPTLMLLTALQYSGLDYLVNRRNILLLMIVPMATLLIVWSNDLHHFYWTEVGFGQVEGKEMAVYHRGPAFWVWITYAYLCLFVGTVLLMNYLQGTAPVFRGQYFVLLTAVAAPWVANVTYLLGWSPWPEIDPTAFGFVVTGLVLGWGMVRFQTSNIVPLARRLILSSMSEAIFVLDGNGNVIDINEVARGIVKDESNSVPGKPISEVFSGLPTIYNAILPAVGDVSYHRDAELNLGSSATADFQNLRVSPICNDSGSFVGTLVELRDINSLKKSEQERLRLETELQHKQKLESLGVMAGGIAHDFNNLLMGISGNTEIAELSLPADSPAQHQLKKIHSITKLAAELCQQMLAYSGKGHFDIGTVKPNDVILSLIDLLEFEHQYTTKIDTQLDSGLPTVLADATQIQQLIMNLLINAQEAIGEGSGTITIQTSSLFCSQDVFADAHVGSELEPGPYVLIQISDTGAGMSSDTVKKMFDPFFTTKFTGRGLGMSAALGIVQGHKGAMKVLSTLGSGTSFYLYLPVAEEELEEARILKPPVSSGTAGGTVLVVDDESYVREIALSHLDAMGYGVAEASNGREAIALYESNPSEITAVLLDLSMPEMDGLACYEVLRQLDENLLVIMMSGYHAEDVLPRMDQNEHTHFLQKPFNRRQLQALMTTLS